MEQKSALREIGGLVFFFGFILPIVIVIGIVTMLWEHEDDFDPEPQPYRTIYGE